jgi:hypothetical protein
MENNFRVGDLVMTVPKRGRTAPSTPEGTILVLDKAGKYNADVWQAYKFLRNCDGPIYVHCRAMELYWRPDAADAERLPDTGS